MYKWYIQKKVSLAYYIRNEKFNEINKLFLFFNPMKEALNKFFKCYRNEYKNELLSTFEKYPNIEAVNFIGEVIRIIDKHKKIYKYTNNNEEIKKIQKKV